MRNDNNNKLWLALIGGAAAGAITALLLAPQTGDEMRRAVRRVSRRLSDDIGDQIQSGINMIKKMRGNSVEDDFYGSIDDEFDAQLDSTRSATADSSL